MYSWLNKVITLKSSIYISIVLLLLVAGCRPDDKPMHQTTPYEMPQPLFFPTVNNIPDDNPMTVEGVLLGERLFHDSSISGREGKCCASCHRQEYSYEFGPDGDLAHLGTHHTMLPLINLVWNTTGLGWNGSVATIEDMVLAAVTDPIEINADTNAVVRHLQSSRDYPTLFYEAFGDSIITFHHVENAIAQYVRSLVFYNSKFDRYLRGEVQLSQDELNGYRLFVTEEGADCFHCHGGGSNALFTTNRFYNNGLDASFDDPADRYAVTGDPTDRGAYKAPTLRNVSLTAPYMHDGRFTTLEEVIDFYSDSVQYSEQVSPLMHHVMQGGVRLTEEEKQQLKAFLNTLTDE